MLKESVQKRLTLRLHRIEVQVRGLERMVDESSLCVDLLTQIAAVQSALKSVGDEILHHHVRLMGKKLLVSLAMEGKFASDGLQAIDEGDDILMAMARELVTEKGIGETADAVWKKVVEKQAEVFGVRIPETSEPEIKAEPWVPNLPEVITPPIAPIPPIVTQLLMFGMSHETVQRPKTSHKSPTARATSNQLGLFVN